ncbi:MAG: CAP domain-containing protein [Acidobacteriota bacterium]
MNARRTTASLALGCLLFAMPGEAQDSLPPNPPTVVAAQDLLMRANTARAAHGVSPLRLEEHLSAMAQRRAEEQARAGMLVRSLDSMGLLERTQAAGYEPHSIAELLASTSSGIPELFAEWERGSSKSYRELLAPEAKDLGAGTARADGVTYVSLLVGLALPDFFRQQTAGLQDLAAMRQEMLATTNAARMEAHRVALTLEPHLVDCAQKYARLMLQSSHYGHVAPDGTTVRERAQAAGYGDFTALGENIAQGQFSVAEVMDGWLHSPAHRENLLSPLYRDVGFGVAFGHDANGWEVLWVQCFGSPR